MNIKLYEIEAQYILLAQSIIDNGGEVTHEQEQALQINKTDLEAKARGYGFIIKDIEHECDVIDSEIDRLKAMKTARVNTAERLKQRVSDAMQLFDVDEIKTPTLKLNFRKSESVDVLDLSLLDKRFIVTKVSESADKKAIKEAIKAGESVQGATISTNLNLQIK
jgi:hypothetical protein